MHGQRKKRSDREPNESMIAMPCDDEYATHTADPFRLRESSRQMVRSRRFRHTDERSSASGAPSVSRELKRPLRNRTVFDPSTQRMRSLASISLAKLTFTAFADTGVQGGEPASVQAS